MNCFTHREQMSVGICKACQKAVCASCVIDTGRGLACSASCVDEVHDLNALIDRSKLIYSIGSSNKLPSSGVIMYMFFGLVFFGFGVYNLMINDYADYFSIVMGLGFIGLSVFVHIRTRKLKLNC